jgi:hypothetical protein
MAVVPIGVPSLQKKMIVIPVQPHPPSPSRPTVTAAHHHGMAKFAGGAQGRRRNVRCSLKHLQAPYTCRSVCRLRDPGGSSGSRFLLPRAERSATSGGAPLTTLDGGSGVFLQPCAPQEPPITAAATHVWPARRAPPRATSTLVARGTTECGGGKSMCSVLPVAAFQPCLVEPILTSPGRRLIINIGA